MKFGTFYYLEIVHIGNGKNFQFQIGVKWPDEDNSPENIPAVLLRLPDESKCKIENANPFPKFNFDN